MSQKPSGYEKIPGDKYYTPPWVVQELMDIERFYGPVTDPAAGAGHIVAAFKVRGYEAKGFDIEPDHDPVVIPLNSIDDPVNPPVTWIDIPTLDFLHAPNCFSLANVVTNPPYGSRGTKAVAFIKRALEVTEQSTGKVAMLLRVDFDSANGRRAIFGDHPAFAAKYVLTKRIHWANLPLKYDKAGRIVGPTENHAWFIWDWSRTLTANPIPVRYGYLP